MPLVTNLLVYLALLQVVEASANNMSALVVRKTTTVKLVGLDKGLCDFIEPPVLPRINVIFLFNTPMAACIPRETSLVEFIESNNKILSYSRNRIKCNLRKREGTIEDTNSTNILPSYTVVLLVTNTFPREWNEARKKSLLYQKVRDTLTLTQPLMYRVICMYVVYIPYLPGQMPHLG